MPDMAKKPSNKVTNVFLFTVIVDDGYSMISLKLIYIVIIIVPMQESLVVCLDDIWREKMKMSTRFIVLITMSPAIEALADGGVAVGLPRELALGLASQMEQIILSLTQLLIPMIG
ncbi:hypothetical protein YC2023_098827 [Brassica napus]